MPPSKHIIRRAILLAAALGVLLAHREARADRVDDLIRQLSGSGDYKVRLSAALNLAKLNDQRAVGAFIRALEDDDKTVRGVAAASLGKLISTRTSASDRKRASEALKRTATRDDNKFVRRQAQKAYDAIKELGGGAGAGSAIYVDVGDMSAKTSDAGKMKSLMRRTTEKTFTKQASDMATSWPGGKPSRKALSAGKTAAYHVDGTLNELEASTQGSSTIVSCKVSMLIATYPDKSMFGFLNGGAKVQAGTSAKDIEYAKEDCVVAVVEDLVARKIIPTIRTRSP